MFAVHWQERNENTFPVPGGPANNTALPDIFLHLIISTMIPHAWKKKRKSIPDCVFFFFFFQRTTTQQSRSSLLLLRFGARQMAHSKILFFWGVYGVLIGKIVIKRAVGDLTRTFQRRSKPAWPLSKTPKSQSAKSTNLNWHLDLLKVYTYI